jgi:cell division protein FtsQ
MSARLPVTLLAWAIALTIVALPVIGVLNGWFALERWPVRYLQIEADYTHVSAEQIRAAAAGHLGPDFFALNMEDVRAAVARLPWVASVEARRRWPDTLVLHVREHQPFARWGSKRLIDRDGTLFSVPGSDALQGLPQLDGPDDALASVVAFYTQGVHTLGANGMTLAGVRLGERGGWTLTLANGSQVLLGHTQVDKRLQRFLAVFAQLSAAHPAGFQRVDLRYSNGFAVLWAEPATPAAPDTQPSNGAPAAAKAQI